MKNKAIILCLLLLASTRLFAQDSKFKLGIRFAPMIAFNKVEDTDENDTVSFATNGSGLRFSAGIFGDFYFGKNYAFHTGLWYTVNRTAVAFSTTTNKGSGASVYNLQMVQIPVALKLFTNEISTDMKLYFTLGGTMGIRINEKRKEWDTDGYPSIHKTEPSVTATGKATAWGDIGLLLGMGAEYQMAESTILYGGISYNRGLLDAVTDKGFFNGFSGGTYTINNQLLGLELGIKF